MSNSKKEKHKKIGTCNPKGNVETYFYKQTVKDNQQVGIPTNSQQFSFTNLEKPKEHNIQGEERGSKDQMEAEVRKRKIMQKLQVSMVYQCKRKTKIEI